MKKLLAALIAASSLCPADAVTALDSIDVAIRSDDLATLRRLVRTPEQANISNGLQFTPLHYAATYGSVETMRFLLDKGAVPNARNQAGATPLILAAWSYERTRLLVEHGAIVNVATKSGLTPLLVAASTHGNMATLRYLIGKGADIKACTDRGEDVLLRAAGFGDADMLRFLLDRGANAKVADKGGNTALMAAATYPDSERVRMLLQAGSDPNALNTFAGMVKNGPIALTHMSALMNAAPSSDQETIAVLLKAGARVNEKDIRGMTPLMLSIATDDAQPATVRQLIQAGADVQAKDNNGDSVLDWAHKFGNPEIVSMLLAAGAQGSRDLSPVPQPAEPRDRRDVNASIASSLSLFAQSDFFRAGGGCPGCHHQSLHARAFAAARSASLVQKAALGQAFFDAEMASRPSLASALPFLSSIGGDQDTVSGIMLANVGLDAPHDQFTDTMVHFLAERQDSSGGWINGGFARPPMEESNISRTAAAIKIMRHYAWPARQIEFESRVSRAKNWLLKAVPQTVYEQADRLDGLFAAGVPAAALRDDASRLLALQNDNGGWAQTKYLQPDAYATGLVLDTLFRAGLVSPGDPAYRRAVAFLLRTQFPDGSWYVRSRAPKFQPYFQSGLPFGHDQWISSAGTAWAVMALSHAAAPQSVASR